MNGLLIFPAVLLPAAFAWSVPIFMTRMHWLLAIFVAAIPLGLLAQFMQPDDSGVPLFNSFIQVFSLYVGLVWILRTAFFQKVRMKTEIYLLLVFLVVHLIAALWGTDVEVGLVHIFRYYLPFTAFAVLFLDTVETEGQFRLIIWAIVLSLAAVSLVEILHVLGCLAVPGLYRPEETVRGRIGGTHGGVASTSFHLMIGLTLAFQLFRLYRDFLRRLLLIFCMAFMLISDIWTYSITGMLALAIALLIAFRTRSWFKAGTIVGTLLTLLLWWVPFLKYRALSKIQDFWTIPWYMWFSGRAGIWSGSLSMILEHPLGVGAGNVGHALPSYLKGYEELYNALYTKFGATYMEPHNTVLIVAGEAGWLGLVLFLTVIGSLLTTCVRALRSAVERRDRSMTLLGHGLLGIAAGAAFFILGTDQMTDKYFWLILILIMAYPSLSIEESMEKG